MNKREKAFYKTNGHCYYCGFPLNKNDFHIEHFVAKSKNRKNDIENIVPSCIDCNLIKGELGIEDFRKKIENIFNKNCTTRLIKKYYYIEPQKITFYFERRNLDNNA